MQKLTCAQLANTYQEDADFLATWDSGRYNGLGKEHLIKIDRAEEGLHEVIVQCKDNQKMKIIQTIDLVIKNYRKENGINAD